MTTQAKRPPWLLQIAAEAMGPVVGGCAGLLVGACVCPGIGAVVGKGVEKAIDVFGKYIVCKWQDWLAKQPAKLQNAAVNELADLPADQARAAAAVVIDKVAPLATPEEKRLAIEYLGAIPGAVRRSLVHDPATGGASLPPSVQPHDANSLLALLPADLPPYVPPVHLPNSPYRLEEVLGVGGFGAVYRASATALQHLPLALKFCLDRSMLPALHQERNNLERLSTTATDAWSPYIVRLYGYDLEHPTPFLVYEYVPGGDLARRVTTDRLATGAAPAPPQVLSWIVAVVRGLAYIHGQGLVHRDLKPANVLLGTHNLKLADFGIGGVVSGHAARHSRIGTETADGLRSSEQASLFRGAGTPLYMSLEQRHGQPPDPRHDLYSLGVLWYQLLVGDVTRELHPGWADELREDPDVPPYHVELIDRCVGWVKKRPRDGSELLDLLKSRAIPRVPVLDRIPRPSVPVLEAAAAPEAIPMAEFADPSPHAASAKVRLRLRGSRALPNAELQVLCNGDLVGKGSFHRGFDIPLLLPVARHQLLLKRWSPTGWTEEYLPLAFSESGAYEVQIGFHAGQQCFVLEAVESV